MRVEGTLNVWAAGPALSEAFLPVPDDRKHVPSFSSLCPYSKGPSTGLAL